MGVKVTQAPPRLGSMQFFIWIRKANFVLIHTQQNNKQHLHNHRDTLLFSVCSKIFQRLNIEIFTTSLIRMLELPNFGSMITSTI